MASPGGNSHAAEKPSPGVGDFDSGAEWDVRVQLCDTERVGATVVGRTRSFTHLRAPANIHTFGKLNTLLLRWVSEYAARAYTTPDNAVLYLNHARVCVHFA